MKLDDHVNILIDRYEALSGLKQSIIEAALALVGTYEGGGKVLVCGNGGSAADSEHIVGELLKGFLKRRPLNEAHRTAIERCFPDDSAYLTANLQESLPAISLVSQTSIMTAFMNDVAADMVFAQQILGYGSSGDALIAISTSGNSANVLNAAKIAKAVNLTVIGMTNEDGGQLRGICDIVINPPGLETYKTQEYHLAVYHTICAMVEDHFFSE
jgi:D-sedoheptulose 7-phosphate isomerase